MNIYEKLSIVQNELKINKSHIVKNNREQVLYKYRSCEDILEGVKSYLEKNKLLLLLNDEIIFFQNMQNIITITTETTYNNNTKKIDKIYNASRYYIKSTATLINIENPEEKIISSAFARENENKDAMDTSQITGATSSYARKYALNSLFLLDDEQDADAQSEIKKEINKMPTYISNLSNNKQSKCSCGGDFVEKTTKDGRKFLGCSNYNKNGCKQIKRI